MSIADVIFWVVVAAGVYWYSQRRKAELLKKEFPVNPLAAQPSSTSTDPALDPFLEQITLKKEKVEASVEEAQQTIERELHTRYADDLELKSRLSEFARKNGLDVALTEVWSAIEHYPTWSKRDDFGKWNKLEIAGEITGEKIDGVESVNFSFGGHQFQIAEKQWTAYDGPFYADMSLKEDGVEVFATSCEVDISGDITRYRTISIKALRKGGSWAMMLLDLKGKLDIDSAKMRSSFAYAGADEIKARFSE